MTTFHHAYLFFAPSYESIATEKVLADDACEVRSFSYDALSIADVRVLKEVSLLFPSSSVYQRIVIETGSIAHEAQHALLKLLEEPASATQFVIVLSTRTPVLKTIYSRVSFGGDFLKHDTQATAVSEFLSATPADRIARIASMVKQMSTAELRALEAAVVAMVRIHELSPVSQKLVADAARYGQLSGASHKLLLEALALELPVQNI